MVGEGLIWFAGSTNIQIHPEEPSNRDPILEQPHTSESLLVFRLHLLHQEGRRATLLWSLSPKEKLTTASSVSSPHTLPS